MNGNSKDSVQVILFSVILLIIPMFIFPTRFGLDLEMGSFAYSIIEIIFYGVVFYFMRSSSTLFQIFQGIGLAFLYRIVLSSLFGLLISVMYGIDLSISLALGVSRYLPAILIHIVAAPFVIRPFFISIGGEKIDDRGRRASKYQPARPVVERIEKPSPRPKETKHRLMTEIGIPKSDFSDNILVGFDTNGFERAVKYLGEHHAVCLAMVVDGEGLTLATFKRGDIDPEEWAPLSLLFQETNETVINRREGGGKLNQLNLSFHSKKIAIVNIDNFSLFVLSDHEDDDVLKIRIAQAAEIIRKYSSERYGRLLSASTEEQHVSNT